MITLFLISVAVAAVVLVLAGWALGDGRPAVTIDCAAPGQCNRRTGTNGHPVDHR